MKKSKTRFAALGLSLAVLVCIATGGLASAAGQSEPAEASENTEGTTNLTAIHDPKSAAYNDNCLSCHANILKESSSDPRVLAFHQAMIPYTPGYNARKGVQNKNCVTCHRDAIDFRSGSGISLRRSVSIESCVYCHGRSGPGPVYFR